MTITAAPGATFESFLQGAPTGLTGTLTWRLIDPSDGSIEIAESTAGITEPIAGSGVYSKSATAPTTADTYLIVWKNGSTYSSEELIVTSTSLPASSPAGGDLTTLAAVKQVLQPSGTGQDAFITATITRISQHITARYGKFRPAETATSKTFVMSNASDLARLPLHPYYLRSATSIEFDTDGTTPTTLTSTDYQLRPAAPLDGVYRWIRLPAYRTNPGYERTVVITGDWGFTSIPADVEEACILAVVERIRGASGFSSQFPNDDTGQPERPVALPRASRVLLAPYDGWGQG